MQRLPLLISVPHAGAVVPEEVRGSCLLTEQDIIADGDEGAREIYDVEELVEGYVTTDVPRAIIDVNRSPDDRRDDGVIKRVTIWNKTVYSEYPDDALIDRLIKRYHKVYHERLTDLSKRGVLMGIDCHTMVGEAPPIDKDPGRKRPDICLGNGDGTCSDEMLLQLKEAFESSFERSVSVNDPFSGGYIVRHHSSELPWVQVEMARRDFMTVAEKKHCFIKAIESFCWGFS